MTVTEGPWPPQGVVFPIARVDIAVADGEHAFAAREEAHIAPYWQREVARNPALYNGRMLLHDHLSLVDGHLAATAYDTSFATFLYWRSLAPRVTGFHLFGMPVMVSADGAIIAVRMAAHTANAGKVYCPAGGIDRNDIHDGKVDIDGNMAREVAEETGIDLGEAVAEDAYWGIHVNRAVGVCRLFRFPDDAETLMRRIRAHMAVDEEKEIAGVLALTDARADAHPYSVFMPPLLDWFFARG